MLESRLVLSAVVFDAVMGKYLIFISYFEHKLHYITFNLGLNTRRILQAFFNISKLYTMQNTQIDWCIYLCAFWLQTCKSETIQPLVELGLYFMAYITLYYQHVITNDINWLCTVQYSTYDWILFSFYMHDITLQQKHLINQKVFCHTIYTQIVLELVV